MICHRHVQCAGSQEVARLGANMSKNIYGIYEGDKLICKGTNGEIRDRYGMSYLSLKSYVEHRHKLLRKYDVKILEEDYHKPKPTKPTSDPEYRYKYALFQIEREGNTICNEKAIDEVLGYLRSNGYECQARLRHDNLNKKDKFWVIERV